MHVLTETMRRVKNEPIPLNTSMKWQNKEATEATEAATAAEDFINESTRQNNYLEIGFTFSFELFTFRFVLPFY